MSNYAKKLINSNGSIYQIQAIESNGLPAYYFIAVKPEKRPVFEQALASTDIDIADYGSILLSGYGAPGIKQKEYMIEQFGFEVQAA